MRHDVETRELRPHFHQRARSAQVEGATSFKHFIAIPDFMDVSNHSLDSKSLLSPGVALQLPSRPPHLLFVLSP